MKCWDDTLSRHPQTLQLSLVRWFLSPREGTLEITSDTLQMKSNEVSGFISPEGSCATRQPSFLPESALACLIRSTDSFQTSIFASIQAPGNSLTRTRRLYLYSRGGKQEVGKACNDAFEDTRWTE